MTETSVDSSSLDLGSDIDVDINSSDSKVPDRTIITSSLVLANQINSNPPSITEFQNSSKKLSIIAKNIESIFSAPGNVNFDLETRKTLLKIICSFIDGLVKNSQFYKTNQISLTSNNDSYLMKSITSTTSMTAANSDILRLNQQIASLHNESRVNDLESQQEKFEANLTIQTQSQQIQSLKEQLSSLQQDKSSSSNEDFQNAMQIKEQKIDKLLHKINHLKNKLVIQEEIIHKFQEKQNSDKILINKLKVENTEYETLISSKEMINNKRNENENELKNAQKRIADLQKSLESLSNICETQANDLCQSRQINHRSFELLNQQNNLINGLMASCESIEVEKSKLADENTQFKQTTKDATNKISLIELEKNKFEKIINNIKVVLGDHFHGSNEELPELLKKILKDGDPLLKQKIAKLKHIVKGQILFLQHFAETGEIETMYVDPKSKFTNPAAIKSKGTAIKDTVLLELAHCRKYIKDNNLILPDEFQGNIGDIQERHFSFQVAVCEILRKECQKNKEDNATLNKIRKYFGFNEYDDVYKCLQEKMNTYSNLMTELGNILQLNKIDIDSSSREIINFVKQTSGICNFCDRKLRRLLNFDGDLFEIPKTAYNIIKKLKKMKTKDIISIKNESNELKSLIESQKAEITEMKNQIIAKDAEISNLKIENVNFSSEFEHEKMAVQLDNSSLRSQNQILVGQLATANTKIENLTHGLMDVQKKLDEAQRDFTKKLKGALQEEAMNATMTIENVRNEARENELRLKEKLKLCSKRIQALKSRNSELTNNSSEIVEKQKQIINTLKTQNDDIQQQIIILKQDKEYEIRAKAEEARAVILSLESEKKTMKSEISVLSSKCQQIESAKDTYWKAQISSLEASLKLENKAKLDELIDSHNLLLQRASSILTKYVPQFGLLNDESFISYLEKIAQTFTEYETRLQQLQNRFLHGD